MLVSDGSALVGRRFSAQPPDAANINETMTIAGPDRAGATAARGHLPPKRVVRAADLEFRLIWVTDSVRQAGFNALVWGIGVEPVQKLIREQDRLGAGRPHVRRLLLARHMSTAIGMSSGHGAELRDRGPT